MKITEEVFIPGEHVRYVPYHAHDDATHPDCEDGFVTSVSEAYVHVRFKNHDYGEACKRDQLVKIG